MNQNVQERLAESLTAQSTDLIPYLPYLLQDFWSLGSSPEEMIGLLREHTDFSKTCRALDLACGKGAIAVHLAKEFGCHVKGIDLMPSFVEEARIKAGEYSVSEQCEFVTGDVNEAVPAHEGYDLVVWGASGDLLGGYQKTLEGIIQTVKPGGYILLDDAYVEEGKVLRFAHNYLTLPGWERLFEELGLTILAYTTGEAEENPDAYKKDLENIRRRAQELIQKYPEQRKLFEGYVKSQQGEYEDMQDGMVPALWLLQKTESGRFQHPKRPPERNFK